MEEALVLTTRTRTTTTLV